MVAHRLAFRKEGVLLKPDLFTFSRERMGEPATQCGPDRALCHSLDCWNVVSSLNRERYTKIFTRTLSERFKRLIMTKLHVTVTVTKMSVPVLRRN